MEFYTYKTLTGEITSAGNAPESMVSAQAEEGESTGLGKANQLTQHIIGGVVTDKPSHLISIDKKTIAAFDQEIAVLTGVQDGATLYIDEIPHIADGTDLELTFYEPKAYEIRVDDFPALEFKVTINAN